MKETKEFFGYVQRGFPMLVTLVVVSIIVGGAIQLLPPVGIPIAVVMTAIFASAALGIVKEIADDDKDT